MRLPLIQVVLTLGFLAGCANESGIKPAEVLDERTGMTVGALQEPMEFVESAQSALPSNTRRASFAYLGPVEWDRMGDISYGLWFHLAPGNGRQAAVIRTPGAVTLQLDDGPLVLVPSDAPALGHGPYQPVVSWGQTSYFELNVDMLKRMAASKKFDLEVLAADDSRLEFSPTHDTRTTLSEYLRTRTITGD
jgi:hypothetical protein